MTTPDFSERRKVLVEDLKRIAATMLTTRKAEQADDGDQEQPVTAIFALESQLVKAASGLYDAIIGVQAHAETHACRSADPLVVADIVSRPPKR